MITYDIHFYTIRPEDYRTPYVRDGETVVYECDGKEGSISFNGYFYVEKGPPPYPDDHLKPWERPRRHSEWLPKKVAMSLTKRDKEPYKVVKKSSTSWQEFHKEYEKCFYVIEIYKMESYESTDEISQIEDFGEPLDVCFFPTNQMKIWFRVLEDIEMTLMSKAILYKVHRMPNTLYANSEAYKAILAWGQNCSDEWCHPVSRHQFAEGLSTLAAGDTIPFELDGISQPVKVLSIGTIYDYSKMKSLNGDFQISTLLVDRVIRVRRV